MSGKSTLSITMRGVTINPDNGYDEYIKTLRIIGFDASGLVCNTFYNKEAVSGWTVMGTDPDTYYEITQVLEGFSGGNCRFYFIANEEGYNISSNNATTLSTFLNNESLTEDGLKACIIASTPDEQNWSEKPILMIANPSAQYIKPGNDIKIADVELVRCIAKVQLIVKKDKEISEDAVVTISNVSLHGTRPDSYSLLDTKSYFAAHSKYQHSFTITNDNKTVGYGTDVSPAYTSDIVYFPETLFSDNTPEGVLYFTFILTYGDNATEKTYTIAIGDDANDDGVVEDYNIYRNTIYTVTATLQPTTNPEMNIEVVPWTKVEVDVPPFN